MVFENEEINAKKLNNYFNKPKIKKAVARARKELIEELKEEIKKKGYIEHDDNFNEWLQINLSFGEFEEVLDKLNEKKQ